MSIVRIVFSLCVVMLSLAAQAQSGYVPSLGIHVRMLRFFAGSGMDIPPPEKREYDELFFYNAARYIYWELDVEHPRVAQSVPFTLEETWEGPGVSWHATHKATLDPGYTDSWFIHSARLPVSKVITVDNLDYGACIRRNSGIGASACTPTVQRTLSDWPEGHYRVEISINGQHVVTGYFRMSYREAI